MVLKEDGSKWACHSCLKGHRVSGCDHRDRELVLVPKKGRPVTQCLHCRQERKKRAAHVACGCGITHTTKDKCVHLRQAESMASESSGSEQKTLLAEEEPMSDHACCCNHGGNCTCAGQSKKNLNASLQSRPKSRLTAAYSDPHMTTQRIGVHKPVHQKPCHTKSYQHPITHSKLEYPTVLATRRSMDNLNSYGQNVIETGFEPVDWSLPPSFFGSDLYGFDFSTLETQPTDTRDWVANNSVEAQTFNSLANEGPTATLTSPIVRLSESNLPDTLATNLDGTTWDQLLEQNPAGELWNECSTQTLPQKPSPFDLGDDMTDGFDFDTLFTSGAYVPSELV